MSSSRKSGSRTRRTLHQMWQQGPSAGSGPFPESFAPTSGAYRPGSLSDDDMRRLRIPETRTTVRDDTPSLAPSGAATPPPGSGPWGPRPSAPGRTTPTQSDAGSAAGAPASLPTTAPFDETGYRNQITELLRKGYTLPSEFVKPVKGIAESAQNILHCMLTDPADVREGDRFLTRYLPATVGVLETYHRLAETDPDKDRLAKVSQDTLSMLERLEAAFRKEHADLLANDVLDLSADMKTIDKLLKMEGH
ncbi:5-bromo-4-chloroindolyl phosphate hydrolysis family protein [Phaeovibrio sulfidiphilus]|uniref:5-bromo-4-chloroindolyl phosphate hydrolysis family protein n=1 Tax=Phaeovibrio sulfidiphilus TaxID=1220600 RepID=A0A8J7CQC8_9PROT|nr:5-bromo-4-chloroindolyl phosphate hydrolysis family protein [Phaeovibrio sulfidiphilus]MBE1236690.1 5-bromo-4-chloroindolyl phosphate hydrolysis family protein [Phaeovibrio sulfidiphilus]